MCCTQEPLELQNLMPEHLTELQKNITGYLGPRIGRQATALPEGFPLASQVDPLSTMGANIMSQYMGGGQYQQPPPGTFDWGMPTQPVSTFDEDLTEVVTDGDGGGGDRDGRDGDRITKITDGITRPVQPPFEMPFENPPNRGEPRLIQPPIFPPEIQLPMQQPMNPIQQPMIGGLQPPPGTTSAFTQGNLMMQSPIQPPNIRQLLQMYRK